MLRLNLLYIKVIDLINLNNYRYELPTGWSGKKRKTGKYVIHQYLLKVCAYGVYSLCLWQ